jgi:hypothetical protein
MANTLPMKRRWLGRRIRRDLIAFVIVCIFLNGNRGSIRTKIYSASSSSKPGNKGDIGDNSICSTSRLVPDDLETAPYHYVNGNNDSKFAYAFAVAACTPESCQPYVLNAIVASTVLKHHNSSSDVVFLARMASNDPENANRNSSEKLSCQQEYWLRQAGIKLYYLPKVKMDNFGTVSLEKFRVLEMTKYERVYFLDADLIPLCNIDYHMELSHRGILQDFVAMQGSREPINAGAFIVTPKQGLFGNVMDIVHRHLKKQKEPTILNPIEGWGHEIADNDRWVASQTNGLLWNFHGFQVDQGLIYYWLKYEILNWSHVLENGNVDTWNEVTSNVGFWRNRTNVVNLANDKKYIAIVNTSNDYSSRACGSLHGRESNVLHGLALDTYHYKGKDKPWLQHIQAEDIPSTYSGDLEGRNVWLYWLGEANKTLNLYLPSVMMDMNGRGPTTLDWTSDRNMLLQPGVELPVPIR